MVLVLCDPVSHPFAPIYPRSHPHQKPPLISR
jgi:hypothetical protein